MPDGLLRGETKNRFRSAVPGEDDAGGSEGDNGVFGVLDDGGEKGLGRLSRPLLGDVVLDGDVAGGCAVRVADGSDPHLLLIESAVLAPVGDSPVPDTAGEECVPQLCVEGGTVLAGTEDAGIVRPPLPLSISGHRREGGIHVLNQSGGIGDNDAVGSLLDGGNQTRIRDGNTGTGTIRLDEVRPSPCLSAWFGSGSEVQSQRLRDWEGRCCESAILGLRLAGLFFFRGFHIGLVGQAQRLPRGRVLRSGEQQQAGEKRQDHQAHGNLERARRRIQVHVGKHEDVDEAADIPERPGDDGEAAPRCSGRRRWGRIQ